MDIGFRLLRIDILTHGIVHMQHNRLLSRRRTALFLILCGPGIPNSRASGSSGYQHQHQKQPYSHPFLHIYSPSSPGMVFVNHVSLPYRVSSCPALQLQPHSSSPTAPAVPAAQAVQGQPF